jgi:hypothetical protein
MMLLQNGKRLKIYSHYLRTHWSYFGMNGMLRLLRSSQMHQENLARLEGCWESNTPGLLYLIVMHTRYVQPHAILLALYLDTFHQD